MLIMKFPDVMGKFSYILVIGISKWCFVIPPSCFEIILSHSIVVFGWQVFSWYRCFKNYAFCKTGTIERAFITFATIALFTSVTHFSITIYQHGISHDDINISWGIEQRSSKYKCGTRRCDLCLSEKTIIAMAERSSLLNRRAEIVSTCRHRTKFRYHMVKKKRPVQALNP